MKKVSLLVAGFGVLLMCCCATSAFALVLRNAKEQILAEIPDSCTAVALPLGADESTFVQLSKLQGLRTIEGPAGGPYGASYRNVSSMPLYEFCEGAPSSQEFCIVPSSGWQVLEHMTATVGLRAVVSPGFSAALKKMNNLRELALAVPLDYPTDREELADSEWLGALSMLEGLELRGFRLTVEHARRLSEIRSLKRLSLLWCQIDDPSAFYDQLANTSALVEFSCNNDVMTDKGLASIATIASLECLRCAASPSVSESGLARLGALPRLRELVVDPSSLRDGAFLSSEMPLQRLVVATQDDNDFCKVQDPVQLGRRIAGNRNIKQLKIPTMYRSDAVAPDYHPDSSNAFLREVAQSISIEALRIAGAVTDSDLQSISAMPALSLLSLKHGLLITNKGIQHLSACHNLQTLEIRYLSPNSARVESTDGFPSLLRLGLMEPALSSDELKRLLRWFGAQGGLTHLGITMNETIGNDVLSCLAQFENLEYLNLGGSQVASLDAFARTIGNMDRLASVVLPNNAKLNHVFQCKRLHCVMANTKPSASEENALRKLLPACVILQ